MFIVKKNQSLVIVVCLSLEKNFLVLLRLLALLNHLDHGSFTWREFFSQGYLCFPTLPPLCKHLPLDFIAPTAGGGGGGGRATPVLLLVFCSC